MKSTTSLSQFYNRHIDPFSSEYMDGKNYRYIPARIVKITNIPVKQENENDWVFEVIDAGNGVKRLAVF